MKILLIGNGFDLEHGLPTSYMDFLDFCKITVQFYTLHKGIDPEDYYRNYVSSWTGNSWLKEILQYTFIYREWPEGPMGNWVHDQTIIRSNSLLDKTFENLRDNPWLTYFLQEITYTCGNWIDFESEIFRAIQQLNAISGWVEQGADIGSFECESDDVNTLFGSTYNKLRAIYQDDVSVDQFAAALYSELERFIRALEIYIAGFVQEIAVERKSPDIEQLQPDRVLSFNYSNTYERAYGAGRDIIYDYIHGKAGLNSNAKTSQLVLGIQEYLNDDRKDQDLLFLPFKKYFQRIYKSTDNAYLSWAHQFQEEEATYQRNVQSFLAGEPVPQPKAPGRRHYFIDLASIPHTTHELYIFGHSLDVTDGDVLRRLICNDNVQTTIFYQHKDADDKSSLAKKIRNLVRIIGQDELIRRTGGPSRTIRFLPQS